jgi:hypothetical protein
MATLEELGIDESTARAVVMVLDKLSDIELNTLVLNTHLGNNPIGKNFWDKASSLFTEGTPHHPKLHQVTKDIILMYKR